MGNLGVNMKFYLCVGLCKERKQRKIFFSEVVRVVCTERLMWQYSDFLTALDFCALQPRHLITNSCFPDVSTPMLTVVLEENDSSLRTM